MNKSVLFPIKNKKGKCESKVVKPQKYNKYEQLISNQIDYSKLKRYLVLMI